MITKAIAPSAAAAPSLGAKNLSGPWSAPAWTMEERLQRIEAMGLRIDGYVQFMCQIAGLNGASAEVKERAVTEFYEQMIVVERQLGRIHENLRLE
ncbi:MAG: hypothetical protein HY040_21570 [Planctomycetes bacterium]|nr:hypothetical protein [Planctomycetota bacterium]